MIVGTIGIIQLKQSTPLEICRKSTGANVLQPRKDIVTRNKNATLALFKSDYIFELQLLLLPPEKDELHSLQYLIKELKIDDDEEFES